MKLVKLTVLLITIAAFAITVATFSQARTKNDHQTVPVVTQTDGYIKGMSILFGYGNDRENFLPRVRDLLDRLETLGVNSVSINLPFFQENWRSSEVFIDPKWMPTHEKIAALVLESHKRGFAVMLRPLLDEKSFHPDGKWRGLIEPVDRKAWFKSYEKLLVELAMLAESEHVEFFSIGIEFNSLEKETELWLSLIAAVREVYSGKITYSLNWYTPTEILGFWQALDFISLDAYYELDAPNSATVDQLVDAWQKWLEQIYLLRVRYPGKKIVITEIGTRSELNSFRLPHAWDHGGPADLEIQKRYYEAACLALNRYVDGFYWWFNNLEIPKIPNSDPNFNPIGKPAEEALAKCYLEIIKADGVR